MKNTKFVFVSDINNEYIKLLNHLQINFSTLNQVEELFPLLSDPKFQTDYIAIDIEKFYNLENIDIFEIIHTLSTLIKCTVNRTGSGKPTKRHTEIVALVNENTDKELIKEITSFPDINFVSLIVGNTFTINDVEHSLVDIINGKKELPKQVQDLLKSKSNLKKASGMIQLTPRQNQILNIISTRGVSNKTVAKMLDISESTVKLHVGAILKKYNLKNRTQLALFTKK